MDKDNRNYVPLIAILGGILAAIIVLAWIFVPKVMNAYTSLPIWSWEAFTLFGLWPGFKTLVQWVIPIAAVTLIIVGIIAMRQKPQAQSAGKDKDKDQATDSSYEKRDWRFVFWFMVPPGYRGVRVLFGEPRYRRQKRSFGPGIHFKWWGFETVAFFDMRKYSNKLETREVSTSGLMERRVQWERALPGVYPEESDTTWIGAQASFTGQVLVAIRDPFLMFDLEDKVRPANAAGFEPFSNDIMSSIMKEAQNRIPLMDNYVLPSPVQSLLDPARIPMTVSGKDRKLRAKLVDIEAKRVQKAQAQENELAKKENRPPQVIPTKSITGDDLDRWADKEELGLDRWDGWEKIKLGGIELGKIDLSKPESYIYDALEDEQFKNSYVGRLWTQGFTVYGYFISDFNPETSILKLIDDYSNKQLLRRNNLVTIRQKIDTEEGDRSAREIHSVGSAKSITVLLTQIADDVLDRFHIVWVPEPEMIAGLILPMEKYRTIRMSKNANYIVDMDRHIPGFGDMITAAAMARGTQTSPEPEPGPKTPAVRGTKPPSAPTRKSR